MRRKKGFTLIEIMIVIAIIGLLSMILIPKVGAIKLQSKNKSVSTNVLLVRTYLENRSGKDGISYQVSVNAKKTQEQALTTILSNVGTDMTSKFSGSNALTNPFSNNSSVVYSQGNVTSSATSSASSVLVYYCIDALPADNNTVSNSTVLPKGAGFIGNVVVVVYSTGYVLYGLDNSGQMINIYIIKFPPTPSAAQSGVTPGNGDKSGIMGNIGDVVTYIKSIAINKIITGAPDNQVWPVMRTPLYTDLFNKFTPGNDSLHIVNPYHANVDAIIDSNNSWVDPSKDYAIIAYPADNISQADTKYSQFDGAVVVYITPNPLGYIVYGIDSNGNQVGRTEINLSTLVTSDMTNTLSNNVTSVYNVLQNSIDLNLLVAANQSGIYNRTVTLQTLAKNQLQSLNLKNAYLPTWTGMGTDTYDFYNSTYNGSYKRYALVVELSEGDHYTDFKGSVILNVLPDASGYEVYGMDYEGNKHAYKKIVGINTAVNDNYDLVVSYLSSITLPHNGEDVKTSLSNHFDTHLANPYNSTWNTIVFTESNNINNHYPVIVSDNNVIVKGINSDYSNYKGCVIVQAHDSSDSTKKYDVYSIGSDGSILKSTTISTK